MSAEDGATERERHHQDEQRAERQPSLPSPAVAMSKAVTEALQGDAELAQAWVSIARELRQGSTKDRIGITPLPGPLPVGNGGPVTFLPGGPLSFTREFRFDAAGNAHRVEPVVPGDEFQVVRGDNLPERVTEAIERELAERPPDTAVLPVYRDVAGDTPTAQMPAVDADSSGYGSKPCLSCGHTLVWRSRAELPTEWPWPEGTIGAWVHYLTMRPECSA